jgi:hypothetical protein
VKSFKGTLFFSILVILVVGFAIYDYVGSEKRESAEASKDSIFAGLEFEDVNKVYFKGIAGEFEFEVKDQIWHLIKPLEDQGDMSALENFIKGVSARKVQKIEVQSPIQWSNYGLDSPEAIISFTSKQGKEYKVELGRVRTFDDGFYLRRNNEDSLLAGDREWASDVHRVNTDFRDKDIYSGSSEIKDFILRRGSEKIELIKNEKKWVSKAHPQFELDQNAVDTLISVVRTLSADAIVAEDQSPSSKAKFNLVSNTMSIQIGEWTSLWSAVKNGDVYLFTSGAKPIYKVMDSKLLGLKKSISDLRSKSQAFALDIAAAKSIFLKRNADAKPIEMPRDANKVDEFILKVREMKAAKYGRFNSSHLSRNKLIIKDANGKSVFEFNWGGENASGPEKMIYARTSVLPDVFLISSADAEALEKFEFVDKPASASTAVPEAKEAQ